MCKKKIIFEILCGRGKYLTSVIDDLVIKCDEIV